MLHGYFYKDITHTADLNYGVMKRSSAKQAEKTNNIVPNKSTPMCNTDDYENATVLVALGFSILTCPQWSQGVNQQSLSLRHPISVSQKNSQNV